MSVPVIASRALSRLVSRFVTRQFAVFLVGGVASAVVDVGVMLLLLRAAMPATAAAAVGFGAGLLVNYAFHSRVTFQAAATRANFARYLCVVALNCLLTVACVDIAASMFGSPVAGKILSLPLVAFNSFLLGKYWIFR